LKEYLIKLGFLVEGEDTEKDLFFQIWRLLGGEKRNIVTLNNLRIFLLAVMGTFIEPIL